MTSFLPLSFPFPLSFLFSTSPYPYPFSPVLVLDAGVGLKGPHLGDLNVGAWSPPVGREHPDPPFLEAEEKSCNPWAFAGVKKHL